RGVRYRDRERGCARVARRAPGCGVRSHATGVVMRNTRRVVITGLGAVTALGLDVTQFRDSLRAGRCGIRPFETVDSTSLRFKNGAEVRDFTPNDHFTEKELDQLDRFAQL